MTFNYLFSTTFYLEHSVLVLNDQPVIKDAFYSFQVCCIVSPIVLLSYCPIVAIVAIERFITERHRFKVIFSFNNPKYFSFLHKHKIDLQLLISTIMVCGLCQTDPNCDGMVI